MITANSTISQTLSAVADVLARDSHIETVPQAVSHVSRSFPAWAKLVVSTLSVNSVSTGWIETSARDRVILSIRDLALVLA